MTPEMKSTEAFLKALRARHGHFANGGMIPESKAHDMKEEKSSAKMQRQLSEVHKTVKRLEKHLSKKAVA